MIALRYRFALCFSGVCLALACMPAGCGKAKGPANGQTVCRLAYTAKGYYAPQFLAARHGWFQSPGVDVQEVKLGMSAGIAAAEALVSGSADVAVMGDVPALIALASTRDCVLIAAYGGGEQMHALVTTDQSGIGGPADLAGKRIGVQFGSSTHGAIFLYFQKHGINPATVQLINMPQKDLIEGLLSGAIDVLAASEPTPMLSQSKVPDARQLAVLSGLDNEYPSLIVAARSFADEHPDAIAAIVAGTRRAVEWINTDPDAAAQETAVLTGVPPTLEAAMFRKMQWHIRLDEPVLDSLRQTAEFLHHTGKLKRIPDVHALARPTFCAPSETVVSHN